MADKKRSGNPEWTKAHTVLALVLFPAGAIAGAMLGVSNDLESIRVFFLTMLGLMAGGAVFMVVTGILDHIRREIGTNPRTQLRQASNNQNTNAKPEPTLKKEDLEWTRSGDDIRGQYRDFVIYLKTTPKTRHSNLYVMATVLRRGATVTVAGAYSHEAAIEKAISVIRNNLDAEREADKTFDMLTGKPSKVRGMNSPALTVNRNRRDFQRYMA